MNVPKSEWSDYYEEAIKVKERRAVPLLGPSVDRRTFQHLQDLYNDEKLFCLICVACAQKFLYREGVLRSGALGNVGNISIHKGAEFARLSPEQLYKNFSMVRFRELYAFPPSHPPEACIGSHSASPLHDVPELAEENWEWRRLLQVPGLTEQVMICCPEDVERSKACRYHADHIICEHCNVPICASCWEPLQDPHSRGIPMAVANDNWVGYVPDIIVKQQVRWIEAAVACPVLTNMIVYYVECEHGHLMEEQLGKQDYKVGSRGNVFSFLMPWDDIMIELGDVSSDEELGCLPHPPEVLQHLVRVVLRNGTHEMFKHLNKVRLRAHVVVQLGHLLIQRQHMDTIASTAGVLLPERIRAAQKRYTAAVHRSYPPEQFGGNGAVPPVLLETLRAAWKEKKIDTQGPPFASLVQDKNATPAEGSKPLAQVWENCRPQCVVDERSSEGLADCNDRVIHALKQEKTLRVQTGTQFQEQFVPHYVSRACPWALPYMVGGPEFPEVAHVRQDQNRDANHVRRWCRPVWAPEVCPGEYVRGMARRVESQIAADWTLLPLLWNLYLRHTALTKPLPLFKYMIAPDQPQNVHAAELLKAAERLYGRLEKGTFTVGGQRRQLAGDVQKLRYADGLTEAERHLLQVYKSLTGVLPGTQQVREKIGHNMFGFRVTNGEGLFITISPNERHSSLMLRLSRARRNDTSLQASDGTTRSQRHIIGYDAPSLFMEKDSIVMEFPAFENRCGIAARDPLSTVYAFDIQVRLVLATLLGIRMCPNCPRCNADDWRRSPCQNKFGHNTLPMGGIFGAVDGIGGAVEYQRAGSPHFHGFATLVSAYQHCTLEHIAELIETKLLHPDAVKAYCSYICREEHFDQAAHDESLPTLETAWKGNYSSPEHRRLCGMWPELFTVPPHSQWSVPGECTTSEPQGREHSRREAVAEGRTWIAKYREDAQFIFSRVQHHWHGLKDGKRVPLNYCKPKNAKKAKCNVCKSGFPKQQEITASALLLCQGVASKFKMRISGRKNALGSVLRKRSCVCASVFPKRVNRKCSASLYAHAWDMRWSDFLETTGKRGSKSPKHD